MSSSWLGSAASDADPGGQKQTEERAEKKEATAKEKAFEDLRTTQEATLSTMRARAAAAGGSSSGLDAYFTSAEKMFERENAWLSRSDISSRVVSEHGRYYESTQKRQGFGFLSTGGDGDWWNG